MLGILTLSKKVNELSIEKNPISPKSDNEEGTPQISPSEKTSTKSDKVHPQHWCGQHKFEADSPTNFYDYTTTLKYKSSMCRVAEIARFNKLRHVYNLQDESGPAHKKLFTVKLVLTPEDTFEGSGTSIKRAQQAAAEAAIEGNKLPLPPEKQRRRINDLSKPHRVLMNVCRTLNYNPPTYVSCNPPVYPDPQCVVPEHILLPRDEFSMYHPQAPQMPIDSNRPQGPNLQSVIVHIDGEAVATGVAETYPLAKQDAAAQALIILGPALKAHQTKVVNNALHVPELINSINRQKSVISDIHEKAHQLKLNVVFTTLKEEGPPHDRQYVVKCSFMTSTDEVMAEAIGKGKKKKTAQQEACSRLLENSTHLIPKGNPVSLATNICRTQRKLTAINREPKRKTIIKEKKLDPDYGHQINPVSRLIQVTQATNGEHPTFELIAEHGVSKFKEFVIQAKYKDMVVEGKGPNKRLAKRAAAEELLDIIGYVKPLPPPGKSLLKKNPDVDFSHTEITHWTGPPTPKAVEVSTSNPTSDADALSPKSDEQDDKQEESMDTEKRRVTFNSEVHACPPPGDQNYLKTIVQSLKKDTIVEGKFRKLKRSKENRRTLTPQAFEELMLEVELFLKENTEDLPTGNATSAHFKLNQISEIYKFSVQYTTFPQTAHKQEFTIVSIGLDTPLVGHGFGETTAEADERAARDAITKLGELATSNFQQAEAHSNLSASTVCNPS